MLGLPRLRPRGEPALRRGAAPWRSGPSRINPRDAWAVHALAHVLYERGRERPRRPRAAAAHPSVRSPGLLQESPALAPGPHAPGRGALRPRAQVFQSVFGDIAITVGPTCKIPCRSRGGSTSTAGRTRGAGSAWARRRAGGSRCRSCSSTTPTWHGARRRGRLGVRRAAARTLRQRAKKTRNATLPEVVVPLIEGLHAFARGDYARSVARIEPLARASSRWAAATPSARCSTTRSSRPR